MGSFISTIIVLIFAGVPSSLIFYGMVYGLTKKTKICRIAATVFASIFLLMTFAMEQLNKVAIIVTIVIFAFWVFKSFEIVNNT